MVRIHRRATPDRRSPTMSAIGLHLQTPIRRRIALNCHEHPFSDALLRISGVGRQARASVGLAGRPLEEWTLATELGDTPSPRLGWCLRRAGVHYGTADRLVMSSVFFGSYVWQLAVAALGCYLLARRVP